MTLTTILAIWGAALSTLQTTFEVIKFLKDRANVRVTVRGIRFIPQILPTKMNP